MPQFWGAVAQGGYLANPDLSKKIRHASQPMLRARQFVRAEPGYGKNKSDRILFNRISNVVTGGGPINELEKMPEDQFQISQGQVIVNEYGNSIPYTGKLEALSEFNVDNIVQKALRNDMAKILDGAVIDELQTSMVKSIPTGTVAAPTTTFDEDGTVSTAATRDTQAFDIKEIVDRLKSTYLTPKYDGENYICLCSVGLARALKDDPDWEDAAKFGEPERLFSGEVGKYYGVRFVETTNDLTNTLGTTAFKGEGIFFGEDPIVEGVAVPEELRVKIAVDYGRDPGIAWLYLGGWSLTYDSAAAGENKSIHHTST